MSQYKRLFSNSLIYGIAPQITRIANIVALPFITKHLTAIDYGISGTLTAYTTSISVLASLGLRTVLVNTYYKSRGHYKWAWRQIYGFLRIWSIPYSILVAVLLLLAIPSEAQEYKYILLAGNLIPILFLGNTAEIAITYYQVTKQPQQIMWRSAVFGILTVALNVYFIAYLKLGFLGWTFSSFISGVLSNITYLYALVFKIKIKPIFNFKRRLIKNSLKISLPTIPHYYSGYLLDTSDRVVMDFLGIGTNSIGKYNASYSIANIIKAFGNASGTAIGPLMYDGFQKKDYVNPRNLVFVLQAVFLCGSFLISIWLKEIFFLLIRNHSLSNMYYIGVIIVMAYTYRPMYFGVVSILQYHEFTNKTWRLTFLAGIINVLLNFILIPFWGFEAAAYTTFVAFMFMGYAGYLYPTFKKINSVPYYPLFWFLLTIALTILAKILVEFSVQAKLFISVALLVLGYVLFKQVKKYKRQLKGESKTSLLKL